MLKVFGHDLSKLTQTQLKKVINKTIILSFYMLCQVLVIKIYVRLPITENVKEYDKFICRNYIDTDLLTLHGIQLM